MKTAEELGTGPGGWETLWSPRGGAAGGEEGGNGLDGGLSMKMGRKPFIKWKTNPRAADGGGGGALGAAGFTGLVFSLSPMSRVELPRRAWDVGRRAECCCLAGRGLRVGSHQLKRSSPAVRAPAPTRAAPLDAQGDGPSCAHARRARRPGSLAFRGEALVHTRF